MIIFSSCKKDPEITPEEEFNPTPYEFETPYRFPTINFIPEDNPLTVEGIKLGRLLFYDGRLSGRTDTLMTCATCHLQENAFECGINHPEYTGGRPRGVTGIQTPHYMLPLINLVWNPNQYLWNGKVTRVSDLVWMGVLAPHEMNGDTNVTRELIQSIPGYRPYFKAAFGTETITMKYISYAVEQFVLSMVSANSKFDRYMRGEEQLSIQELQGLVLFTTEEGADCFHCHGGDGNPLFTTHDFYNNGKDSSFTGPNADPRDRYHVTFDPQDLGAYKATTLRNISYTGPYMHDGRFATLDDVIEFYNTGLVWSPYVDPLMHKINDGGAQLTPQETAQLKAFLLTLNDDDFINNPDYGPPTLLPQ